MAPCTCHLSCPVMSRLAHFHNTLRLTDGVRFMLASNHFVSPVGCSTSSLPPRHQPLACLLAPVHIAATTCYEVRTFMIQSNRPHLAASWPLCLATMIERSAGAGAGAVWWWVGGESLLQMMQRIHLCTRGRIPTAIE